MARGNGRSHRRHQHWIHDFVAKVGPRSEAPSRYLYWAAVATLCGALRRRCYIDWGTFEWYPNWYLVLVGPPGLVKKSTTIDIATKLLRQVDGVVFGSDCTTWQQFVAEVAGADDAFAMGGTAGGGVLDQEYVQSKAITFAISEFGTFFNPKDFEMVNVLTHFYDGNDTPFKKSTKTQGIDIIASPFVNLIAGTTPRWLAGNFQNFCGWGLSARTIFLYADDVSKYVPYPDEVWGDEAKRWQASFVEDLAHIASLQGQVHLSQIARETARPWYKELMERIKGYNQSKNTDAWTQDYLQRKWAHMWKLAMALSISRSDSMIISEEDVLEAKREVDKVEDELSRVFRGSQDDTRRRALAVEVGKQIVLGLLMAGGRTEKFRIYRHTLSKMNNRETDDLVNHMCRAGLISAVQEGAETFLLLEEAGKSLVEEKDLRHAELPGELLQPAEPSLNIPALDAELRAWDKTLS